MYNKTDNMYYYKCKGGTVDASKYFLKGDKVGSLTEGSLKKQCRKMLVGGGGDLSIIKILKIIIDFLLQKIQPHNENKKYGTTLATLATLKTAVNSLSGSSDNPNINTTQNDIRELEENLTLDCDTKLELIKLIVCDAS